MKLYYSPGACSLAPHVALREIGAAFELVEVRTADKANFRPDYLAVNPRARVPALEVDGQIYTEVAGLLVYIAAQKPALGLLPPASSPDLARCLEWVAWFSSGLHIAYAQHFRPERFLPEGEDNSGFTRHALGIVERMSGEVEARQIGPWLLGDAFTIADVYALPFYRWGNRVGLAMAVLFPRWTEWSERMIERPAVREAIAQEGIGEELFRRPAADALA